MENQNRNQNSEHNRESGRPEGQATNAMGTEGNLRGGTTSVNPDSGDMGIASRDYQDPHGNQSGREPEGGSGAGQSRGDESSFNPGNPASNTPTGERRQELQGYPKQGDDSQGVQRHDQPAEGGRDQYGARATEDPRI